MSGVLSCTENLVSIFSDFVHATSILGDLVLAHEYILGTELSVFHTPSPC